MDPFFAEVKGVTGMVDKLSRSAGNESPFVYHTVCGERAQLYAVLRGSVSRLTLK